MLAAPEKLELDVLDIHHCTAVVLLVLGPPPGMPVATAVEKGKKERKNPNPADRV